MVTKEKVKEALKKVIDPEIGLSIVDLGLIYDIKIDKNSNIFIKMTLTVPGCPLANFLTYQTEEVVKQLEGVNSVKVELVWDPPWNPSMMSKEAKRILGWEDK